MSVQSEALDAAFALITRELEPLGVEVLRDEFIPQRIPPAGLVIFHFGETGEPDITLNPRSEYYQHRAEVEIYALTPLTPLPTKEDIIYSIYNTIERAINNDPGLGGRAIFSRADILELDTLDIDGAPEILSGTFSFIIEYETQDLLA